MDERTNKQTNERYMRVYFKRACLPMLLNVCHYFMHFVAVLLFLVTTFYANMTPTWIWSVFRFGLALSTHGISGMGALRIF